MRIQLIIFFLINAFVNSNANAQVSDKIYNTYMEKGKAAYNDENYSLASEKFIAAYKSASTIAQKNEAEKWRKKADNAYELQLSENKDDDNDGIKNRYDNCRYTYGYSRYNGCPIPDKDGDGFNDEVDECPDKYATTNKGCPASTSTSSSSTNTISNFVSTACGDMIAVVGGRFLVGSSASNSEADADEKPYFYCTLDNFYMSKYEITVAQFKKFVDETNYKTDAEKNGGSTVLVSGTGEQKYVNGVNWRYNEYGNVYTELSTTQYPVIHVSWSDAMAFCNWANKFLNTGFKFKLPTEAQWEYAAGNKSAYAYYPWGKDNLKSGSYKYENLGDKTFYTGFSSITASDYKEYDDGTKDIWKVGTGYSNALGFYDMGGNVLEWCLDDYIDYNSTETKNRLGYKYGSTDKLVRGGCFITVDKRVVRTCNRWFKSNSNTTYTLGFRVVVVIE